MSKVTDFPSSAKLLHWLSALLIICMLFLGVSMIQSLAPWHDSALRLHQSVGVLVLILVCIRLINRLLINVPALPTDLSRWQRLAAKGSQVLLYLLMVVLPISGWLMQNAAGLPVSFFGIFQLPLFVEASLSSYGLFRELHALLAWSLFAVIVLHISAALHHGMIRKDSVLPSMLFKFKSRK